MLCPVDGLGSRMGQAPRRIRSLGSFCRMRVFMSAARVIATLQSFFDRLPDDTQLTSDSVAGFLVNSLHDL